MKDKDIWWYVIWFCILSFFAGLGLGLAIWGMR